MALTPAWERKAWEGTAVQTITRDLWARCRMAKCQDDCPPCEEGTEGTGRMSEWLYSMPGRRDDLSGCGFDTPDVLEGSLGCKVLLHTSEFSPAWAAKRLVSNKQWCAYPTCSHILNHSSQSWSKNSKMWVNTCTQISSPPDFQPFSVHPGYIFTFWSIAVMTRDFISVGKTNAEVLTYSLGWELGLLKSTQ